MSSLESICPHCLRAAQVPEARIGRRVRCPWCDQRFQLSVERVCSDVDWRSVEGFYYLGEGGERAGPFAMHDLIERKEAGVLTKATQVWREGWPHWKYGDALFTSLGGERDEVAVIGRPAPSPELQTRQAGERVGKAVHFVATAAGRLRCLLFACTLTSAAAAAVLLFVAAVWRMEAALGGAIAMALSCAAFVLASRHARALYPAVRAWAESGEPSAGADALTRMAELLVALCWSFAGLVLAVGTAIATAVAF